MFLDLGHEDNKFTYYDSTWRSLVEHRGSIKEDLLACAGLAYLLRLVTCWLGDRLIKQPAYLQILYFTWTLHVIYSRPTSSANNLWFQKSQYCNPKMHITSYIPILQSNQSSSLHLSRVTSILTFEHKSFELTGSSNITSYLLAAFILHWQLITSAQGLHSNSSDLDTEEVCGEGPRVRVGEWNNSRH